MNRAIGMVSSVINGISILGFVISMVLGNNYSSYFCSMFIAFSFVPMMCAYAYFSERKYKVAGFTSVGFAAMYATMILLVYFAQLTTVRLEDLNQQAATLLDYQKLDLFFNYDLLGYGLMALATFFAGLTIQVKSRMDKWLKGLLLVHGIFFISCLIMPMLGVFTVDQDSGIGVIALEFWCGYFIPISIMSFLYFSKYLRKE